MKTSGSTRTDDGQQFVVCESYGIIITNTFIRIHKGRFTQEAFA